MATVNSSTVSGNSANNDGGGVFNDSTSSIALNDSLVTTNSTASDGGGIYNDGGSATLASTTVSANTPDDTVGI